MTERDVLLFCSTITFQLLLVVFVYARNLQRRLPFFAAYATLALTCSIVAAATYHIFGIQSQLSYYCYWIVVGVEMVARCLVVVELCRYGLSEYLGIWGLAWRFLILLTFLFIGHAALDASGQPNRFFIYSLTFERDVNIASLIILLVLLSIRRYYGLSLEPLQRMIALGLCFYCVVDIFNSTVLRDLLAGYLFSWFSTDHMSLWPALRPQVERVKDSWTAIRFSSYIIAMSIWCFALRKPLPKVAKSPDLLPPEVYGVLSPMVNVHLRAFNDRLLEMLNHE